MTSFSAAGRTATGRELFKEKPSKKPKAKPSDTPTEVLVSAHGRYQIKSGRLSGEYVARAFPAPPTNARGLIAEAKGATEEAAIAALHEMIDAREDRRTGARRADTRTETAVPSIEEYLEALSQITLSRPQRAMLIGLGLAEDEGLTEAKMARAAGYKSIAAAHRSFAAAGLLIANYLSMEAAADGAGTAVLGYSALSGKDAETRTWTLHPELREAVRSLH